MTAPVLDLSDVRVLAGGQPILDAARFSVDAGEIVALVGPNGAGKTTLLHVAALLRHPDRGSIKVLGKSASSANLATLRRSFAVVFQDPLLFNLSVLDNAAAGARFQGHPRAEAERRARLWLDRFGVAHLTQRNARKLSGGEAGRVALARAFVTDPVVVLLDEPFNSLDAPTRDALLPTLRDRLRETGTASVLVTHNLEEAFAFADRIDVMNAGRIIASGEATSLIARPPSLRAASLLGIETILPARVVSCEADMATIMLDPNGPTVTVCTQRGGAIIPGQHVTMTIPAGALHVQYPGNIEPPGLNHLPGRVVAATPHPSGTRLVIETPAPFVVTAFGSDPCRRWVIGDRATVAFPPEAANLLGEAP